MVLPLNRRIYEYSTNRWKLFHTIYIEFWFTVIFSITPEKSTLKIIIYITNVSTTLEVKSLFWIIRNYWIIWNEITRKGIWFYLNVSLWKLPVYAFISWHLSTIPQPLSCKSDIWSIVIIKSKLMLFFFTYLCWFELHCLLLLSF